MVERRQEPRTQVNLAVRIFANDVNGGTPFTQIVKATGISAGGALVSKLSRGMRPGDLLWVEYRHKKARFRIVWTRDSQSEQKTQAGQRVSFSIRFAPKISGTAYGSIRQKLRPASLTSTSFFPFVGPTGGG